jgi:ABC-2 type transport system permease protein
MRNVVLVIKHEIIKTIGRPAFWLMAFIFPLVIFGLTFGSQLLAQDMVDGEDNGGLADALAGEEIGATAPIGYVDLAGIVDPLPEDGTRDGLRAFADRDAAAAALQTDEISAYYVVPEDVVETGEVLLVQSSFTPFEQLGEDNALERAIMLNLAGDEDVAALLLEPMPSVIVEKAQPDVSGPDRSQSPGAMMGSTVILFVFFFVLTMSSGYILRSVTKEKENRVVEVLLLSLRPRELMLGKMLGLGAVALLQMAIWLGASVMVLREGSPIFGMAASLMRMSLPSGFIVWSLLYFLFGYLMFAALLGALGALAPTMREGSQFTFAVLLPLMIPMWLNTSFAQTPNGGLVTFLSLFPLTSPVSMMARYAATDVPIWQLGLSLVLLGLTAYGFVLLAARFFRADTLLSQAPLNLARIKAELFGRKSAKG